METKYAIRFENENIRISSTKQKSKEDVYKDGELAHKRNDKYKVVELDTKNKILKVLIG